jgi:hypothetical protein
MNFRVFPFFLGDAKLERRQEQRVAAYALKQEEHDAKLEGRREEHDAEANDKWEEKYAEFEDYDGMPETTSTSYVWQKNQLTGFDGKIKKEIAANEGSTIWRDRRARLVACIVKKNKGECDVKYAEFKNYDGMPESKSASYI